MRRRLSTVLFLAATLGLMTISVSIGAGLQPTTAAFLQELGINPNSPEVTAVANDQADKYSLDSLAAKRDEDGVKRFIATRNFIRKFHQNPKTPQPPADLYNMYMLTTAERAEINDYLAKHCSFERLAKNLPFCD